jgi:hypothetical protein
MRQALGSLSEKGVGELGRILKWGCYFHSDISSALEVAHFVEADKMIVLISLFFPLVWLT